MGLAYIYILAISKIIDLGLAYIYTGPDTEIRPPKSGGAFFQKFIFCFYSRRTVPRPRGVLPCGLGVANMMKIKNLKYFFEKSLFSIFPEPNPV